MLAKIRAAVTFPLVVLVVGFGFSMAINVMATLPDPHLVMGGVMASIALPAAIHLWPMVPAHHWISAIVRALVMSALALMAAYITFRHGATLMMPKAPEGQVLSWWDEVTGYLYTLITEALVVLGVMAHRAQHRDASTPKAGTPKADVVETGAAAASPETLTVEPSTAEIPADGNDETEVPDEREIPESPRRRRGLRAVGGGGAVREKVRAEYMTTARQMLAEGRSLDEIVLAQVDVRAGASKGYAKKYADEWRVELEAELAAAGEAVS